MKEVFAFFKQLFRAIGYIIVNVHDSPRIATHYRPTV